MELTFSYRHNGLATIPPALLLLPDLEVLNLSHNSITTLDFSSPIPPSDEGLTYGAGFLTTAISRAATNKGPKPVLPVLRSLNLGYNKLRNDELKSLARLKALRVLNLEANQLDGAIDVDGVELGEKDLPELAALFLSGNKRLRAVTGSIASNGKIDTEGCNLLGQPSDEPGFSSSKPTISANAHLDIPLPTMTVTYRTLPAATFDSLPLEIELDLYLPSTPCGSSGHPLVIWFHGGGLLQGNKENLPPHFRRLPAHDYNGEGVAVISPNYRLAPQVPILDILDDVTALLSFVRRKLNDRLGSTHRIDTSRICLSGGSAGGYLALIAGIEMPRNVSDEEVGGYRGDEGIRCIAPFYPITDLTDEFWAIKLDHVPWRNSP